MEILIWAMLGAVGLIGWSTWSCARSYYERGRLAGVQHAILELERGVSPPLSASAREDVRKAVHRLYSCVTDRQCPEWLDGELWRVGALLGDVCWREGHAAGLRRRAPAEGIIRLDLSLTELLQLGGLANLGFQNLMPNFRNHEFRRFSGEEDAREAVRAISRLEATIPKDYRPNLLSQVEAREKLIADYWWVPSIRRLSA